MASRISSFGRTQETTKRSHRSRKPQTSKRQLGSTSVEWITPLKCHKPRASTANATRTQVVSKAASAHVVRCTESGRKSAPVQSSSRPNSSRQNSRLQPSISSSSSHSLLSNTSQGGLGVFSKPLKLVSRPSSSQEPHNKWSATRSASAKGITPPQGFDLASYVKQNGTAQGIIIGKNGQPTSDDYFDAFLSQCQDEIAKEQTESIMESEYEISSIIELPEEYETDDCTKSKVNECAESHRGPVPLCWEEQLALSECLRCVTPNLSENSLRASKLKLKESLRVKVVLNDQCLLERTNVKSLQDLTEFPTTKTTTEGKLSSRQQNHVLDILLYSTTKHLQQQLLNQSFEVCVVHHATPESTCVFEGLTPRRVLSCVSVITVHFEKPHILFSTEIEPSAVQLCSVTVWFEQQRSLLFSAQLQEHPSSPPPPPEEGEGFVDQVDQQLVKSKESERPSYVGPPEVPEKFFHKRASYYNQDEDEDRTDIAVISSYLPELKLIENEVPQPTPTPQQSRPPTQRETSSSRPTTATTPGSNTFNYSSRSKPTQRVVIIPSVSESISRHQSTIELRKSWNNLLSDEKRLHRKSADNSNTFSVIANNWIGRYF